MNGFKFELHCCLALTAGEWMGAQVSVMVLSGVARLSCCCNAAQAKSSVNGFRFQSINHIQIERLVLLAFDQIYNVSGSVS